MAELALTIALTIFDKSARSTSSQSPAPSLVAKGEEFSVASEAGRRVYPSAFIVIGLDSGRLTGMPTRACVRLGSSDKLRRAKRIVSDRKERSRVPARYAEAAYLVPRSQPIVPRAATIRRSARVLPCWRTYPSVRPSGRRADRQPPAGGRIATDPWRESG
jgi:hypothetical protein